MAIAGDNNDNALSQILVILAVGDFLVACVTVGDVIALYSLQSDSGVESFGIRAFYMQYLASGVWHFVLWLWLASRIRKASERFDPMSVCLSCYIAVTHAVLHPLLPVAALFVYRYVREWKQRKPDVEQSGIGEPNARK